MQRLRKRSTFETFVNVLRFNAVFNAIQIESICVSRHVDRSKEQIINEAYTKVC